MPNRMLRDCTDSESVNRLCWQAEVLFYHLIMKADDYGRYYADPQLLKSYLFPRRDVRTTDIARWIAECETSGLIARYVGADDKTYAAIRNFRQRMRSIKSKFPAPPWGDKEPPARNGGNMTDMCQSCDGHVTARDERRETGINDTHNSACAHEEIPEPESSGTSEILTYPKNDAAGILAVSQAAQAIGYAITDEEAENFISYYEATGWRVRNQPVRNWKSLLVAWRNHERNQVKKGGKEGKKNANLSKYNI